MPKQKFYWVTQNFKWYEFIAGFLGDDESVLDPEIKLFVPDKVVIYGFKRGVIERWETETPESIFSDNIYYSKKKKDLEKISEGISSGLLEVLKEGVIQDKKLIKIVNSIETYLKSEIDLERKISSNDKASWALYQLTSL